MTATGAEGGSGERREERRHARRLRVRFWPRGEGPSVSGLTGNLSRSGLFLTAPKVFTRGTRLRLELPTEGGPVTIEGEVAHAHRVPVDLRALGTSGMGVRFLAPGELVEPMLPAPMLPAVERQAAEVGDAGSPVAPSPVAPEPRAYAVSFAGPREFLECFERDLVNGGLFLRTERPRPSGSVVDLRFHLPEGSGEQQALEARGRVVQVIGPEAGDGTGRGGMGLELLDLESLLRRLRPAARRLKED